MSHILLSLKYHLGIYYHWYFRKSRMTQRLKERKGKCRKCGVCCRKLFGIFRCPFLKGDVCRIHDKWFYPVACKATPLREKSAICKVRGCGYYWSKPDDVHRGGRRDFRHKRVRLTGQTAIWNSGTRKGMRNSLRWTSRHLYEAP